MQRAMQNRVLAGVVMVLLAAASVAADGVFTMFWENDSRYTKPQNATDRHYTSGSKLVWATQPDWQWVKEFSDWDLFSQPATAEPGVGLFLGLNMYTPDHVGDPSLRSDTERVFAGWLYTGIFVQRRQADVLDHFELNVGVVGPSARAHHIQKRVHQMVNSVDPVGWEAQLGDEPAANVTWVRRHRHSDPARTYIDFISDYGFTAGSLHRHLEAGMMLRCGLPLPDDFGPGRMMLPHTPAALDSTAKRSAYLFTRFSGRAVEHDRFLSGLSHKPLTGRAEVGVVCRYENVELAYSQTFMTKEFKQQDFADSYASITLTVLF